MRKRPQSKRLPCPKCGGRKCVVAKVCRNCLHPDVPKCGRLVQLITGIAHGKTIKEIALEWNRSVKTVEFWWAQAKSHYGFQSQVEAALYAVARGFVELKDVSKFGRRVETC